MTYSHRLTIAAPVAMIDSANAIARSMDPDVGGAESFASVRATKDGAEYSVCDVWVRESFATQAAAMLGNPALLHGACAQDYAARWPDMTAPTMGECEAFIGGSLIRMEPRTGRALGEVLEDMGAALVLPEAQ